MLVYMINSITFHDKKDLYSKISYIRMILWKNNNKRLPLLCDSTQCEKRKIRKNNVFQPKSRIHINNDLVPLYSFLRDYMH